LTLKFPVKYQKQTLVTKNSGEEAGQKTDDQLYRKSFNRAGPEDNQEKSLKRFRLTCVSIMGNESFFITGIQ